MPLAVARGVALLAVFLGSAVAVAQPRSEGDWVFVASAGGRVPDGWPASARTTGPGIDLGCALPEDVCEAGSCIDCLDTGDAVPHDGCADDAGAAYCVQGACAECRTNADCLVGDAIFCDPEDHVCRGCETGGECADRDLGAACLGDGTCAECDDAADCGGNGCDPRNNVCSPNNAGTVSQCLACRSDDDCEAGSACVSVSFPVGGGAEVGTYCALGGCSAEADPDFYCAGNVGRGNHCLAVPTRGGVEGEYCVPATTTCEAYKNAETEQDCANRDECSADGAGPLQDAYCVDLVCSYECDVDAECPPGAGCGDIEGHRCAP